MWCRWPWCFELVGPTYQFWVKHPCSLWSLVFFFYLYLFFIRSILTRSSNIFFSRIAELFAFLVCTKWSNPAIYQQNHCTGPSSSSQTTRQLDWTSGLMVSSEEDENEHHMCGTQNVGGHVMKIPLIAFEVFLCMHLEVLVHLTVCLWDLARN